MVYVLSLPREQGINVVCYPSRRQWHEELLFYTPVHWAGGLELFRHPVGPRRHCVFAWLDGEGGWHFSVGTHRRDGCMDLESCSVASGCTDFLSGAFRVCGLGSHQAWPSLVARTHSTGNPQCLEGVLLKAHHSLSFPLQPRAKIHTLASQLGCISQTRI